MRPDLLLAPWAPPGEGELPGLVVLFARWLRRHGVHVDPSATSDAISSARHVDAADLVQFHRALQANLAVRREDLAAFDDAFATFWLTPAGGHDLQVRDDEPPGADSPGGGAPGDDDGDDPAAPAGDADRGPRDGEAEPGALAGAAGTGDEPVADVEVRRALYSPDVALRERDFRELSADELQQVRAALERMPRLRLLERSRRSQRSPHARGRIDFRRTFRSALATGEPLPRWRQPRRTPERLVLLLDVSRSMDGYTEPLLHFARGLCRAHPGAEAFLFSTSVARVTSLLRAGAVDDALALAARERAARSSGTAMGESLAEFQRSWGARGLGRHWVTLVASDGWDWGDPGLLAEQMARIRRRSRAVLWLNPAMRDPRFRPLCAGMTAALPYLDALLPCHSLARLVDVADRLAALDAPRA